MADNNDLNPKSFRITDDTAGKFKEIASEIGGNQQETMAKLIEAYEFQKGKVMLVNKKADIEKFESYITLITQIYMNTLADNQNITDLVRAEFAAQLISKDSLIQDLQVKLAEAKADKKIAEDNYILAIQDKKDLAYELEDAKKKIAEDKLMHDNTLKDKDNLNRALTDSCNELKQKVESMTEEYHLFKEKSALLDAIVPERDSLLKVKNELEEKVVQQKEHEKAMLSELETTHAAAIKQLTESRDQTIQNIKQKAELDHQVALLEIERKYQEEIQQLKKNGQAEIDRYQQKYLELLEKQDAIKEEKKKEK